MSLCHDLIDRFCSICISISVSKSNAPGYERELPRRMANDHCAIDTDPVLSYRQITTVHFEIVRVVGSSRFWGLVQYSSDFLNGVPLSRGGCPTGSGQKLQ